MEMVQDKKIDSSETSEKNETFLDSSERQINEPDGFKKEKSGPSKEKFNVLEWVSPDWLD